MFTFTFMQLNLPIVCCVRCQVPSHNDRSHTGRDVPSVLCCVEQTFRTLYTIHKKAWLDSNSEPVFMSRVNCCTQRGMRLRIYVLYTALDLGYLHRQLLPIEDAGQSSLDFFVSIGSLFGSVMHFCELHFLFSNVFHYLKIVYIMSFVVLQLCGLVKNFHTQI